MTSLCIETSTQVCSAAICIGGVPTDERISENQTNHAMLLPRFVDELLDNLTAKGLRVEAVAVSAGPGSYTGLRIGASLAKGFCYGKQIPLIPIDTLKIMCVSAAARARIASNGLLCPMIDARRMEVYTNLYDADLHAQGDVTSQVVTSTDWLNPHTEDIYYFGDGAEKCQTILTQPNLHYIAGIRPEAKYMGILAEQMLGQGFQGADVAYFEPFYLKQFIAAPSHVKGLK